MLLFEIWQLTGRAARISQGLEDAWGGEVGAGYQLAQSLKGVAGGGSELRFIGTVGTAVQYRHDACEELWAYCQDTRGARAVHINV